MIALDPYTEAIFDDRMAEASAVASTEGEGAAETAFESRLAALMAPELEEPPEEPAPEAEAIPIEELVAAVDPRQPATDAVRPESRSVPIEVRTSEPVVDRSDLGRELRAEARQVALAPARTRSDAAPEADPALRPDVSKAAEAATRGAPPEANPKAPTPAETLPRNEAVVVSRNDSPRPDAQAQPAFVQAAVPRPQPAPASDPIAPGGHAPRTAPSAKVVPDTTPQAARQGAPPSPQAETRVAQAEARVAQAEANVPHAVSVARATTETDPTPTRAAPSATEAVSPSTPVTSSLVSPAASGPVASAAPPQPTTAPVPAQAVAQHVEMMATQGGGTARLRLHPARLGEVEITVVTRGSQVDVVVRAAEPLAEAAIAAQREGLVEALGSRDLRMESFNVLSSRDRSATGQEAFHEPGGQPFQGDGRPDGRGRPMDRGMGIPAASPNVSSPPTRGAPRQGVDLRI